MGAIPVYIEILLTDILTITDSLIPLLFIIAVALALMAVSIIVVVVCIIVLGVYKKKTHSRKLR